MRPAFPSVYMKKRLGAPVGSDDPHVYCYISGLGGDVGPRGLPKRAQRIAKGGKQAGEGSGRYAGGRAGAEATGKSGGVLLCTF